MPRKMLKVSVLNLNLEGSVCVWGEALDHPLLITLCQLHVPFCFRCNSHEKKMHLIFVGKH